MIVMRYGRSLTRLSTAVMVAAALAVAGCGGGGAPTTTTTTTGERTPAQLAAAATEALDAAKAAVDMVTVSADRAKVTDADAAIEKARAAVAAASGADSHTALSQRLETLKTSLANSKDERGKAQMTALKNASTALAAALKAIEADGDGSTVEQFTAATEALAALEKAVADATDLTDAQKKDYKEEVALANGPRLRERRVARIVRAITETEIAAAGEAVSSNAEDATAKIAAARTAIEGADIPDAEKGKLLAKVEEQEKALDRQKRIAGIVKAITDGEIMDVGEAIKLITALSEESTVTDVEAAIAAARKAIADAQLPDVNKQALRARLAAQETAFGAAKMDRADGAKRGKALHAAMAGPKATTAPNNALTNLQSAPYYVNSLVDSGNDLGTGEAIGRRGDFRIDPAEGAGVIPDGNAHKAVFFRHVDSEHIVDEDDDRFGQPHSTALPEVPKKGKYPENFDTGEHGNVGTKWYVTDFTRTTGSGDGRVTDRVRVYNDKVGGPLADTRTGYLLEKDLATYFATSEKPVNAGTLDTDKRQLSIGTGVDRHLAAPVFDRSGAKTYDLSDGKSEQDPTLIKIPGTYMGAPGDYYCPSSGTCTVGIGVGGWFLSADWYFVYDEGAKVQERDFDHLYFGWWIREDDEGTPAAVSAFYRSVGGDIELATDGGSLNGTARFEGPAVGVYAIHDPLNEKGDGGDFTATAKLLAKFGATNLVPEAGMTGTIDGFRLDNGSEPNWSVTLQKGAWTTGASREIGAQKGHTDKTAKTVWSINGAPGTPGGSWEASLYDEAVGTIADGGDGSDRPSSVLGKFYSEHGDTHRMVGAFGAKIQLEE